MGSAGTAGKGDNLSCLNTLNIQDFRNLKHVEIKFHSRFNFFYGTNGSGKSSLLEAIYHLAYGKSYRNHLKARIIRHQQKNFLLFANFSTGKNSELSYRVGIEKSLEIETVVRLNNQNLPNVIELAYLLPVQLINPNSFEIIEEGPSARRKFLDWGVFHVEPCFYQAWQKYARCLKQRNSSLKLRYSKAICQSWDEELVQHGEILTQHRQKQLAQLEPIFCTILKKLAFQDTDTLKINFSSGWTKDESFQTALSQGFDSDYHRGTTQKGPHRADIQLTVNGIACEDVLSRGQEKLMVTALQIAQAISVAEQTDNVPIYLIDDLSSELDQAKRQVLFELLNGIPGQFMITATGKESFPLDLIEQGSLFHVEQGCITHE